LSLNVGWQLEAHTGAQQAVPADGGDSPSKITVFIASIFSVSLMNFTPPPVRRYPAENLRDLRTPLDASARSKLTIF